jgi:hypothetical protein
MSAHPALTGGKTFPGKQVGAFEQALRQESIVLETTPDDALEALKREAGHRPPCSSSGKGGQDTTVWLTAVRASRTPDSDETGRLLPVILVSDDQAFADSQDRHSISPWLWADRSSAGMLLLAPTVVDALSRAQTLRPLVESSGCGFSFDPVRPELLAVNGRSVMDTLRLGGAVLASIEKFRFPG